MSRSALVAATKREVASGASACATLASMEVIAQELVHAMDMALRGNHYCKEAKPTASVTQAGVAPSVMLSLCVLIRCAQVMAFAAMAGARVELVTLGTLATCPFSLARIAVGLMVHAVLPKLIPSAVAMMVGQVLAAILPSLSVPMAAVAVEHVWMAFALAVHPLRAALVQS